MTEKYFEFGTAYHLAMETYYNPETWYLVEAGGAPRQALIDMVLVTFCDKVRKQKLDYLRNSGKEALDLEEEQDYAERLELGKGMIRYYFNEIAPKLDHFKPVQVEVSFDVPIVNPDTGEMLMCYDKDCYKHKGFAPVPVTYGGRCDLLIMDEHGNLYILDWKTAARVDHEALLHLELDDQVGSYPWAFRELGIKVSGFVYHQQKKGFPEPPTENKNVRLGRKFSVSKSQDTDFDTYLETVQKFDNEAFEAGLYDDFLTYLQEEGVRFYNRVEVHLSEKKLDSIGQNIFLEAQEMVNPNLPLYPLMARFTCSGCAFREPCIAQNEGEDYEYALNTMFDVKAPYWETNREPNSDKRSLR